MNSLLTNSALIKAVRLAERKDYTSLLSEVCNNKVLLSQYATWSDKKYTRNCLYRDDKLELILICWEPNQQTSIHNHGGEECWLGVCEGLIEEQHFIEENAQLKLIQSENLQEGQVSYMNDKLGIHRLKNTTSKRVMTLHLYAKPIDQCDFYCEDSKKFITTSMKYDSKFDIA